MRDADDEEELVDVRTVAARFQCGPCRVAVMCREGRFEGAFQPCPGGKWRIPKASVEAFLARARAVRR